MPSSKLQPALLGGLTLAVLSALPFISIGNLCCCLWILSGGALAAYLLQAGQEAPINTGDGAAVGLLAGVIGAVIYSLLSIPIGLVMGPFQARLAERVIQNAGEMPDNLRPILEAMRHGGFSILGAIFGFVFMLILSVTFSTLGGIIGAALFKKKVPPGFVPPPVPPYGGNQ